jgi:hypothetical protein
MNKFGGDIVPANGIFGANHIDVHLEYISRLLSIYA